MNDNKKKIEVRVFPTESKIKLKQFRISAITDFYSFGTTHQLCPRFHITGLLQKKKREKR